MCLYNFNVSCSVSPTADFDNLDLGKKKLIFDNLFVCPKKKLQNYKLAYKKRPIYKKNFKQSIAATQEVFNFLLKQDLRNQKKLFIKAWDSAHATQQSEHACKPLEYSDVPALQRVLYREYQTVIHEQRYTKENFEEAVDLLFREAIYLRKKHQLNMQRTLSFLYKNNE